jgi:tetratricopeptide (TPR) repeat protein
MLVLEDLHWADRSTRELLGFLTRSLRRSRVLIVGTYRADDLTRGHPLRPFLAELDRLRNAHRLELEPLSGSETAEQLAAIVGPDLPPGLADEIFLRAEGNPFFTEELACAVQGSSFGMGSVMMMDNFALSETLRDLLLIKVEQLPEGTQRMLRLLSAGLPPVDHRVLLHITETTEDELNDLIRPAFQAHVLVPGDCGVSYRFRHALMREAVHSELLPGEHAALHRKYAELLEDDPSYLSVEARDVELAHHWYSARDYPRAYETALNAAHAAATRYAYSEEHRMLERALELWDQVPSPDLTFAKLLYETACAAHLAGDPHRSLSLTEKALKRVDPAEDPETAALLHSLRSRDHRILGRSDGMDDLYAAMNLVSAEANPEVRVQITHSASFIKMLTSDDIDEGLQFAQETSEIAERIGSDLYRIHGAITMGTVMAGRLGLGAFEEGLDLLRRATQDADAYGDPSLIARAHINLSSTLEHLDRHAESLAVADAGLDAVRRRKVRLRTSESMLWGNRADALRALGRWDEAATAVSAALDLDPPGIHATAQHEHRAELALLGGDAEEARRGLAVSVSTRAFEHQYSMPRIAREIQAATWLTRTIADARKSFEAFRDKPALAGDERYVWRVLASMATAEADHAESVRAAARTGRGGVGVAGSEADGADVIAHILARAETLPAVTPSHRAYSALLTAEVSRWRDSVGAVEWDFAAKVAAQDGVHAHQAAYIWFRAAESLAAQGDRESATAL